MSRQMLHTPLMLSVCVCVCAPNLAHTNLTALPAHIHHLSRWFCCCCFVAIVVVGMLLRFFSLFIRFGWCMWVHFSQNKMYLLLGIYKIEHVYHFVSLQLVASYYKTSSQINKFNLYILNDKYAPLPRRAPRTARAPKKRIHTHGMICTVPDQQNTARTSTNHKKSSAKFFCSVILHIRDK